MLTTRCGTFSSSNSTLLPACTTVPEQKLRAEHNLYKVPLHKNIFPVAFGFCRVSIKMQLRVRQLEYILLQVTCLQWVLPGHSLNTIITRVEVSQVSARGFGVQHGLIQFCVHCTKFTLAKHSQNLKTTSCLSIAQDCLEQVKGDRLESSSTDTLTSIIDSCLLKMHQKFVSDQDCN